MKSNLRPGRMRRSRPVRYFLARGWRANWSRSSLRDDDDKDDDDDVAAAADDDDGDGPALGATSDCDSYVPDAFPQSSRGIPLNSGLFRLRFRETSIYIVEFRS